MAYENWAVEWDMPVVALDKFNRYSYYSWGRNWSTLGGTPENYNVDGERGTITLPTGDTAARAVLVPGSYTDIDAVVTVRVSALATGANINGQLRFRSVDDDDFYVASLAFDTGGNVDVSINRSLAGVGSVLVSAANVVAYSAGTDVHVYAQARGSLLRAKAWVGDQDDPPQAWTVEVTDANHASGQVGARASISGGNTNVNPTVLFDNFRAFVPERWVDVTAYVDTARGDASSGGSPFVTTSGDTAESSADTGGLGLPLQNADQRFTPGNVLSPYWPNIAPGRRVRTRETVADQVFYRFTCYVQYPEIEAWTESSGTSPRDQLITIPLVDRVAWIAQGRKMVSTLGEHIIYHGGSALVAFWSMGETEGPDVNPAVGGPWTITKSSRYNGFANAPTAGPGVITYGSAGTAIADDLSSILFAPSLSTNPIVDYVTSLMLVGKRSTSITLAAGQVITVVCWTRPGAIRSDAFQSSLLIQLMSSANSSISVGIGAFGGSLFAFGENAGNWSGNVTGPVVPQDQAIPVAVRVGFSPAVLELWVRGEVYTGTLTVTSAAAASFDQLEIGERYPGAVNHAQVYLGGAADWANADFLAQRNMGLYGMERQSTGERIRTILQYAGVDPSELGRIDDGVSLMQVAALAGRSPIDAITDAVNTEQGEFWAAGDNRPVFADRVRLYNI